MPGTVPVPLTCEVPEGRQAAPPEEAGAPQAAFVAPHVASRGSGFMPNVTVTGSVREDGFPRTVRPAGPSGTGQGED
ncbi:hypothetical protein ABII15_12865 [Streptomyces sp. HUAS MG91]|uniref:Uncharacterized protein n=1 Tax=Streptomyces tabacisoli TaxID=3156398 RepID=A0AAU8IRC9_9ACTN